MVRCNTLFNLHCTEVRFAECIEINIFFKQWLYLYIGEVDLLVWCEESVVVVSRWSLGSICFGCALVGVKALHCREFF